MIKRGKCSFIGKKPYLNKNLPKSSTPRGGPRAVLNRDNEEKEFNKKFFKEEKENTPLSAEEFLNVYEEIKTNIENEETITDEDFDTE